MEEKIVADLLIACGSADPNLAPLARAAERAGRSVLAIVHGAADEPAFSWDLETGRLTLDGREVEARAAFLRYDVFTPPGEARGLDRNAAWYAAAMGWAMSLGMKLLNRDMRQAANQKPYMLRLARDCGLATAPTLVSNVEADLRAFAEGAVAKPVAGGGYVRPLDAALPDAGWKDGRSPMPAIVQERLAYPEYRIYLADGRFHLFEIHSPLLDYRTAAPSSLVYRGETLPWPGVAEGLAKLAEAVGIDFCACDFKTRPGEPIPLFLELNSGPMFAAYDLAAEGRLADALVAALTG
ncbi:MAG: hypothetical protein ABWX67_13725 [Allosphingosinicella sp.]